MSISNIVDTVSSFIEGLEDHTNIELEVRLGVYDSDNKRFESNIGEDAYDTINTLLDSFKGWEVSNVGVSNTYGPNNLRLSQFEDGTKKCIEKTRLKDFTYVVENLPFDIRISISRETPTLISKFPKSRKTLQVRDKKTLVRNFQNASFELSKVTYNDQTKNLVEVFEYEVEHIGDLKNNTKESVFQLVYKALDALFAIDGFIKTEDNQLPLEIFTATQV